MMEILTLKRNIRNKLAAILDIADSWRNLAGVISKQPLSNNFEPLYSAEQIWSFQVGAQRSNESPTSLLLEDWSRRGNPRPNVEQLLEYLMKIENYRAANFVNKDILKRPGIELISAPIQAPPNDSEPTHSDFVSSSYTTNETVALGSFDSQDNSTSDDKSFTNSNSVIQFTFEKLRAITDNFNTNPYSQGGRKLGEGAFGTVFFGKIPNIGDVAVKQFKGEAEMAVQFKTEVHVLSRFQHENLLALIGYSFEHDVCLVYEYMPGLSLQDRLACKRNISPLTWPQRLSITLGTARGLLYLHTSSEKPLVHRDIKSANVLLDHNLVPKIGDFGLARIGSQGSGSATTAVKTNTVFGSSVYMAREAFHGDISAKMDVFSYGVVLFEILTGLPPYDESREEKDLLSHVNENYTGSDDFFDPKAAHPNLDQAQKLFAVAEKCTIDFKSRRPTMMQVMPDLEDLLII